jgi:toxin ParE1/3/4
LKTRVIIAPAAAADTQDILTFLAERAGNRTASKYAALFERLYDRLEDFPASGAPRPALGSNIRIGIVRPYIIIYRHLGGSDTATVLRIVHGRRDITRTLLRRSP